MFCQIFAPIPVFCGENQPKKSPKKSKTAEKLMTRLQRQKDSRYQVLSHRRHLSYNESSLWEDSHDGYQSDDSSDSRCSAASLDQISHLDIVRALLYCQPSPESETILNIAVSASLAQIDRSDFDHICPLIANFFSPMVLYKMSIFMRSKGVRLSLQVCLTFCLTVLMTILMTIFRLKY